VFTVPNAQIDAIRIVLTLVGGGVVYDTGVIRP